VKFLADMGVARTTVLALRGLGHDVEHILDTGPHDLPDAKILERARADRRAVVTFDLDFGDLLAARAYPAS
jgi:predicted nuclease of predicted toxin-antitoxin system